MKTIIIACGAGVATSTMICSKLKKFLEQQKIEARIVQCSNNEINSYISNADLIVSSAKLEEKFPIPFLVGIPLISGVNIKDFEEKVIEYLT